MPLVAIVAVQPVAVIVISSTWLPVLFSSFTEPPVMVTDELVNTSFPIVNVEAAHCACVILLVVLN